MIKTDKIKEEIRDLGLSAIKEYFQIDLAKLDPNVVKALHKKADLALRFDRELNIDKRTVELNYIRVFRLIAEDKAELRRLIKKSLPKYIE